MMRAARANLRHALSAALLMLPHTFTARELYRTIAGLSYTGDFRMVFGENPNKVSNIVNASMTELHGLYAPVLAASFPTVTYVSPPQPQPSSDSTTSVPPHSSGNSSGDPTSTVASSACSSDPILQQDTSPETRLALGLSLPIRLQQRMAEAWVRRCAQRGGARGVDGVRGGGGLPDSPRSAAISLAERGRLVIQRLQLQRLQWLVSKPERRAQRVAAVAAASSLFGGGGGGGSGASSDAAAEHQQYLHLLEDDELRAQAALSGLLDDAEEAAAAVDTTATAAATPSPSDFSRAVRDPAVVAFWEAMLQEQPAPSIAAAGHGTAACGRGGGASRGTAPRDLASNAALYLRPAIAHVVGTHARTQSLKGVLTAGGVKASVYAAAKLSKYLKAVLKRG